MKRSLMKATNRLLKIAGLQIVKTGAENPSTKTPHGKGKSAKPKAANSPPPMTMNSLMRRLVQTGVPINSIIDIGASDGKWSLNSMNHFPDAMHLGIDPLEERREALEAHKKENPNFDYALCVAGDVDGKEVSLNVTSDLDGSTVDGENPGISRTCPVRTIDSLVAEKKLSGPFLLKFDTHGYELPILSGSKNILPDVSAIIMENYNFQLTPTSLRYHEMCAHLEQLGFRTADIADPMWRLYDKMFWQIDILFLRKDSDGFKYQHYE